MMESWKRYTCDERLALNSNLLLNFKLLLVV